MQRSRPYKAPFLDIKETSVPRLAIIRSYSEKFCKMDQKRHMEIGSSPAPALSIVRYCREQEIRQYIVGLGAAQYHIKRLGKESRSRSSHRRQKQAM